MALRVELVSPERIVYSGEADMVIARTVEGGDIAFLDGHTPFVGALEIATATIVSGDREEQIAVHGGFVEVSSDAVGGPVAGGGAGSSGPGGAGGSDGVAQPRQTIVTILSDAAELADEIDIHRARQAKERAEHGLRDEQDEHDVEAEAALRRAHVRLAAVNA